MATSQFTIYSSGDVGAPTLNGTSGSLINVLEACLVSGYTGHTAAGWTHPIATSASAQFPAINAYAAFEPPSGSGLVLFVNDYAPGAGYGREARITGWESMTSLCPAVAPGSNIGAGRGNFPNAGYVVVRKSSAWDQNSRYWMVAADAYTVYMWAQSEASTTYYHWGFGDVFSLKGANDLYRCFIYGRTGENSAVGHTSPYYDQTDELPICHSTQYLTQALPGHYMARSFGSNSSGTAITITRKGDLHNAVYDGSTSAPYGAYMTGQQQYPNGPDNSIYVSPLWVVESPVGLCTRGRFRGLYQVCHPVASFTDGQTFYGSGDYAGKSFMIIKTSVNGGFWALETSNTVETN